MMYLFLGCLGRIAASRDAGPMFDRCSFDNLLSKAQLMGASTRARAIQQTGLGVTLVLASVGVAGGSGWRGGEEPERAEGSCGARLRACGWRSRSVGAARSEMRNLGVRDDGMDGLCVGSDAVPGLKPTPSRARSQTMDKNPSLAPSVLPLHPLPSFPHCASCPVFPPSATHLFHKPRSPPHTATPPLAPHNLPAPSNTHTAGAQA